MMTSPLQGQWIVLELESSGVDIPVGTGANILEFAGDKMILGCEEERLEMSCRTDTTTAPISLDLEANTDEGGTDFMTGIAAFEGELLRVCWNESVHGRPSTFQTNARTTGFSFVLRRAASDGK